MRTKARTRRKNNRFLLLLVIILGSSLTLYFLNSNKRDDTIPVTVTNPMTSTNDVSEFQDSGLLLEELDGDVLDASMIEATSAILIDGITGEILVRQNSETALPVASMSKMMTVYIVLEQIEQAKMNWEDQVVISGNANNIGSQASRIWVVDGNALSVRDLFHAMVVSSANNAAIALAEHIAGSEEEFTRLMNEKAELMGLSDQTHFVNSTGLPGFDGAENQMTAEDVAQLAYQLLQDFPEVLEATSLPEYEMEFDGTVLWNTNAMLLSGSEDLYFKVDGLKTGFTNAAGYCFAGTAIQGDRRLISVVMGAENETVRFLETVRLLTFGFEHS